jgi:hypothetical protein
VRGRKQYWWLDLLGRAVLPEPAGIAGGLLYLYRGPALE